ncbi:hypothetical protein [Pseudalkalibacillus caeni]|uniref:Uncharacterized protein n=1 Tax=Exobacillus caeni TaxID=2574798 RepID=A0A5R9F8L6_9BACL|nr:hypothetical protein [Pseudalkalibacillus caeni]TLS37193.1 hypothetical protein FCL54_11745 [Pseudalkalibacillus caeni]
METFLQIILLTLLSIVMVYFCWKSPANAFIAGGVITITGFTIVMSFLLILGLVLVYASASCKFLQFLLEKKKARTTE